MPEPIANSSSAAASEPELNDRPGTQGRLQKNLKPLLYLGAACWSFFAVFGSTGAKTPAKESDASNQPPQPLIQDNTDNNVQDMKKPGSRAQQRRRSRSGRPALAMRRLRNRPRRPTTDRRASLFPCVRPSLRAAADGYVQRQLTPSQQENQQLAAKDVNSPTPPASRQT